MYAKGKRMPARRICPISRIAIPIQGKLSKGGVAADKPTTTAPAISATNVSREGWYLKNFEITVFTASTFGLLSV